jgi:3-oxoacyl-[acyl-carrier-protein] synthase II
VTTASTPLKSVPLAVSGWGVTSSLGIGAEEFGAAWRARRSGLRDISGMYEDELPVSEACALPDFKVRDILGRKGTSFFDRTTSLTVVTTGLALKDSSLEVTDDNREEIGIALGSTTGGMQALCDFITETIVNDPPYLVNAIAFPYAVMNGAASSAAIWHQLKGVNATISDGQASFLAVLKYCRNQIRSGYVEAMLAAASEEFTPSRVWASEHLRDGNEGRVPLGEGSAAFVLEPANALAASGRKPDAVILSVESSLCGQDLDPAEGLADCIGRALQACDVAPWDVRMVAASLSGSPRRDVVERRGIEAALGGAEVTWLPVKDLLGETYSASGALQLAAVLAEHREDPGLDGAVSLITSVTSEGLVGAAVVRGWSRAGRD